MSQVCLLMDHTKVQLYGSMVIGHVPLLSSPPASLTWLHIGRGNGRLAVTWTGRMPWLNSLEWKLLFQRRELYGQFLGQSLQANRAATQYVGQCFIGWPAMSGGRHA